MQSNDAKLTRLHFNDDLGPPKQDEDLFFILVIASDHSAVRRTQIMLHRVPPLQSQDDVERELRTMEVNSGLSFVPNPNRLGGWMGADLNGGWDYELFPVIVTG